MKSVSVSRVCVIVGSLTVFALSPLAQQAKIKTITEWDLQTTKGAVQILNDGAARFEKANPGYKVEQSHIQNDAYKTKLKIAFGANQPPNVFSSWGGGAVERVCQGRSGCRFDQLSGQRSRLS